MLIDSDELYVMETGNEQAQQYNYKAVPTPMPESWRPYATSAALGAAKGAAVGLATTAAKKYIEKKSSKSNSKKK